MRILKACTLDKAAVQGPPGKSPDQKIMAVKTNWVFCTDVGVCDTHTHTHRGCHRNSHLLSAMLPFITVFLPNSYSETSINN